MQKVVTNTNPEIHVQNGSTQQESVLVGSANQIMRLLSLVMLGVIIVISYAYVELLQAHGDVSKEVGVLTEKVRTLEDIVINKTLEVR